ncbi:MAG TPA: hypothetical protein VM581_03730 [Magnetospirillaceae bacterium]|nr:hypothetical protein [Magnetospirillaceae bacterium]
MNLTELAPIEAPFRSPEYGESIAISFAEAAELSHGPYDSPEQKAQRVAIAEYLEVAMQPGAAVLHQVNRLAIRGGTLHGAPSVVLRPYGTELALALSFDLAGGERIAHQEMYVRDLAERNRPGAPRPLPRLVVGKAPILEHVESMYHRQRAAEKQPGGIPWNDISPLTELYTYGALATTSVRLTDVAPAIAESLCWQILNDLVEPEYAHLAPMLEQALRGLGYELNGLN